MQTQEQVIREQQIRIAHALGSAYGHLWATTISVEEAIGLTPEEIDALVTKRAQDEIHYGGIYSPWMNDNMALSHATGSGRLTWEIWGSTEDGLTVEVHRPSGRVLAFEVLLNWVSETHFEVKEVILREVKPLGTRHILAAQELLNALGMEQMAIPFHKLLSTAEEWDKAEAVLRRCESIGKKSSSLVEKGFLEVLVASLNTFQLMIWEKLLSYPWFQEYRKDFWENSEDIPVVERDEMEELAYLGPSTLAKLQRVEDDDFADPYADFVEDE